VKSTSKRYVCVLSRLTCAAIFPTLLFAAALRAQSPSLVTVPMPQGVSGPGVFDSAGNFYSFQNGPATPGAYQTANGGGMCLFSNGFFSALGECTDAYVGKVDPGGNLIFGTFLGGNTNDQTTALTLDAAGNIYITGTTGGGFPTTPHAAISSGKTGSAFAAKFSADGSRLIFSTFLPDGDGGPTAIGLDSQGNIYIAGRSNSDHAFAVKLNPDASAVLYNVTLGGSQADMASAMHVDTAGNTVITGQTASSDFPVSANAIQSDLKGTQNLFIARLDANGRTLYSTFLGGSGSDSAATLQTDSAGNIYIAGMTSSLDFPTTPGSFEPTPVIPLWNKSAPMGFALKLSSDATTLAWSTYVMSADGPNYTTPVLPHEGVTHLAVTPAGDAYIAAIAGTGFPTTASAPQACFQGPNTNIVVAHLNSKGALADATYLGDGFVAGLSVSTDALVNIAWSGVSQLRFGGTAYQAQPCLSPNPVNSATFVQDANIVPGELITLTGLGIGPEIASTSNVQVLFDGRPAPILYAQSRQINVQAPVELGGKTQTSISVMYNKATIGTISANVDAYGAPGIFRLRPGLSAQSAVINQDGTTNGPSNPASRGSVISMWGTGFGMITPPCATGGLNPASAVTLAPPLFVWFSDGFNAPPTQVTAQPTYAGSAPGLLCGIVQINRVIPDWVAPGIFQFYPMSLQQRPQGDYLARTGLVPVTVYVK
jgi:uncharacterized protein (TIGR03437 family)